MQNEGLNDLISLNDLMSLAISKVLYLALIKAVPISTAEQLNIMISNFIWQGNCTPCND